MALPIHIEAMASHQPYRPGAGVEKALAEIARQTGNRRGSMERAGQATYNSQIHPEIAKPS